MLGFQLLPIVMPLSRSLRHRRFGKPNRTRGLHVCGTEHSVDQDLACECHQRPCACHKPWTYRSRGIHRATCSWSILGNSDHRFRLGLHHQPLGPWHAVYQHHSGSSLQLIFFLVGRPHRRVPINPARVRGIVREVESLAAPVCGTLLKRGLSPTCS